MSRIASHLDIFKSTLSFHTYIHCYCSCDWRSWSPGSGNTCQQSSIQAFLVHLLSAQKWTLWRNKAAASEGWPRCKLVDWSETGLKQILSYNHIIVVIWNLKKKDFVVLCNVYILYTPALVPVWAVTKIFPNVALSSIFTWRQNIGDMTLIAF